MVKFYNCPPAPQGQLWFNISEYQPYSEDDNSAIKRLKRWPERRQKRDNGGKRGRDSSKNIEGMTHGHGQRCEDYLWELGVGGRQDGGGQRGRNWNNCYKNDKKS